MQCYFWDKSIIYLIMLPKLKAQLKKNFLIDFNVNTLKCIFWPCRISKYFLNFTQGDEAINIRSNENKGALDPDGIWKLTDVGHTDVSFLFFYLHWH